MCGRYYYESKTANEVEKELGINSLAISMKPGDITPGMMPITLSKDRGGAPGMIAGSMFWGITGKDNKLIINARADSVTDKPMFSESMERRRCILPAAGFYEWDKDKNKVTFFRADKNPIYLAGLYNISDNKDSFAIITTAANSSMIDVHDRMPLMIEREYVKDWILDNDAAHEMLSSKMPLLERHRDYEQLSLF